MAYIVVFMRNSEVYVHSVVCDSKEEVVKYADEYVSRLNAHCEWAQWTYSITEPEDVVSITIVSQ